MTMLRLLLGAGAWLASVTFNASLAFFLYRELRAGRRSINAVIAIFLMIFTTTAVTLIFGLSGQLTAARMGGVSALGLALMVAVPGTRRPLGEAKESSKRVMMAAQTFWADLSPWLRWFSGAALIVSLVRFGFLIWTLPPFVWDSLTYHLTNVAHWVQVGRIELWSTPMVRIYTPANYEVLASWFALFLHHDAFIEAAGLPPFVLAVTSVYAIGRHLGLRRESAWIGAAAYAVTPALLLATTGTKNDPHMAGYFLCAMALVLDIAQGNGREDPQMIHRWIALALVLFLAAGTKAYIANLLPGLVLIGAVASYLSGGRERFKDIVFDLKRGWDLMGGRARMGMALLLLAGFFVGGYWNVRNWILTGNPFFPYGVSVEGEQVASGPHNVARMNVGRLVSNLKIIAQKFGDRLGPVREDLPDSTGWGWFVYVLGIPALLWGLWRHRWVRVLFAGFSLAAALVLMATRPSSWNMRYIIWFPAVLCLAFAFLWDHMVGELRWIRGMIGVIFAITTGLNLMMTMNDGQINPDQFGYLLDRSVWSRHAASFHETVPAEYENALVYVPKDEVLGYNVHGNGFIYPLYRADFSQQLVYIPVSADDSCAAIAERMQASGTRWLVVAEGHSPPAVIELLEGCSNDGSVIQRREKGLYALAK